MRYTTQQPLDGRKALNLSSDHLLKYCVRCGPLFLLWCLDQDWMHQVSYTLDQHWFHLLNKSE